MGQIKVTYNLGGIEGLCLIESTLHGDSRGYFMETFSQKDMYEAGLYFSFVQDNQSMSTKGVLRGLHFQKKFPQTKLVRVIKGSVYDVAVDLRAGSPTFGKYYGVVLTEDNLRDGKVDLMALPFQCLHFQIFCYPFLCPNLLILSTHSHIKMHVPLHEGVLNCKNKNLHVSMEICC